MHACPVIKQKLETLGSLLKVFEQYSLCRSYSVSDNVTKLEHLLLIIIFFLCPSFEFDFVSETQKHEARS